jgi:adenylate cyclase
MNFIITNRKSCILFLSCFFYLIPHLSHSQQNSQFLPLQPLVELNELFQKSVYSFTRDSSGVIYLGTSNQVLRFDGELKPCAAIPGEVLTGKTRKGRIVVAGYNSFGFLGLDQLNRLVYQGVSSGLIQNAGQVLQMVVCGDEILLRYQNSLLRYSENGMRKLAGPDEILDLQKVDDNQVLAFGTRDIFLFSHSNMTLCPGNYICPGKSPDLVLPADTGCWFRFGANPWLFYKTGKLVELAPSPKVMSQMEEVSSLLRLPDGRYFARGKSERFLLFSRELDNCDELEFLSGFGGRGSMKVLSSSGENPMFLFDNKLYTSFWETGIRYFPSSLTALQDKITRILIDANQLCLVAGNQLFSGLVSYENDRPDLKLPFVKIGIGDSKLCVIGKVKGSGGGIWVLTSHEIFLAKNGKPVSISGGRNINYAMVSDLSGNIYTLENQRLIRHRVQWNSKPGVGFPLLTEDKLEGNYGQLVSVAENSKGELWLQTEYDSLIILDSGGKLIRKAFIQELVNSPGIRLEETSKGIAILSSKGISRFTDSEKGLKSFFPTTKQDDFHGWSVYPFGEDQRNGQFWMVENKEGDPPSMRIRKVNTQGVGLSSYLPSGTAGRISAITADSAGWLWIASGTELLCEDIRESASTGATGNTILTSVKIGSDSILPVGDLMLGKNLRFSSGLNTFSFHYANTGFKSSGQTVYKYFLKGLMSGYSEWSSLAGHEFTSLDPGSYTLYIVSKELSGEETRACVFPFTIIRPFYFRWFSLVIYGLLLLLAGYVYIRWRSWHFMQEKIHLEELISKRTEELTKEKEKSEQLLANILPKDTADELKKRGKVSSQKYDLVTVLFSDIQGFTRIAEQMNPETLIDQLDMFYFQFDSVAEKYNIEKIKTIGDAYMCAGGIPDKNRTNPVEVVLAGLEMQQFMKDLKLTNSNIWDLRIGIHTGPVIAGVVGHKKFSYDIWGDTVNVASRMESSGEAGKVNISGHTYELVRDYFICEYRGRMPVKYKGEIDMYFVKGIRPELSLNLKGLPNRRFFTQLQNLRFMDLEEFVVNQMEKTLPANFYFHNLNFTIDIYTQCELLGRAEGLSDEELLIIRTAGLLQGMGYILDYHDPANRSASFAEEVLPGYKYDASQVTAIAALLRSREKDFEPTNNLERIYRDASLNYLGRPDFVELSDFLLKEINEHGRQYSPDEWLRKQERYLDEHPFYTEAAKRLREFDAASQIAKLKDRKKNT